MSTTQSRRWRAAALLIAATTFAGGTVLGKSSWVQFAIGLSFGVAMAHNDIYQPATDQDVEDCDE